MASTAKSADPASTSRLPWEAIGLTLTLIPLIATALRLIRVSELNPTVLFILVQNADLIPLISASTLQALPLLLNLAVITFLAAYQSALPDAKARYYRVIVWAVPFTPLALLVQSLSTLMMFVMLYLLNIVFFRRMNRRHTRSFRELRREQRSDAVNQIRTTAFLVTFLLLFSSEMWLPPQIVTHSNRQDVGYVLQEGDRFTTILLAESHQLVTIRTTDLEMLQPCGEERKFWNRPLFGILLNGYQVATPKCPEPGVQPKPQPSTTITPAAPVANPTASTTSIPSSSAPVNR